MPATEYEYHLPDHPIEYGVLVPVDEPRVDAQSQRILNKRRAQAIAEHLQISAIGTITLSRRSDGSLWVVDGQHRQYALRLAEVRDMPCEIHEGLTREQEAVLFLIKNRESARPGAFDEYKIGLTGQVRQFVDTERVLREHKLRAGRGTTAHQVGSVAAVVRITENYSPAALDWALTVAEGAWGRTDSTWDGNLLGGLARFYYKHPDLRFRAGELVRKLAKKPAYAWVGEMNALASGGNVHGTGSQGRANAAYRIWVAQWNKGRRANHKIPTPYDNVEEE